MEKIQVIHDQGESPKYDEIANWTMTDRGPAFTARNGDQWWLHVGSDSHGPFDAAGITVKGTKVFGVVVTADNVEVVEY